MNLLSLQEQIQLLKWVDWFQPSQLIICCAECTKIPSMN